MGISRKIKNQSAISKQSGGGSGLHPSSIVLFFQSLANLSILYPQTYPQTVVEFWRPTTNNRDHSSAGPLQAISCLFGKSPTQPISEETAHRENLFANSKTC